MQILQVADVVIGVIDIDKKSKFNTLRKGQPK